MTIFIAMAITAVPMLILGLFIRRGKGFMFIAGYNTMPEAERSRVDKAMLSKVVGNLLLRLSLEVILAGAAGYFKLNWLMITLIFIAAADTAIAVVRLSVKTGISRQGRFANNKIAVVITVVITAATLIGVCVMLYSGAIEPTVNIEGDYIQITGMYGMTVDFADVQSVELIEKNMRQIDPNAHRDNGYGGVETLKGHFSSNELGKYMLFVYANSSPTVKIVRNDGKDIYISFKDGEKTSALYQKLTAAVPSD